MKHQLLCFIGIALCLVPAEAFVGRSPTSGVAMLQEKSGSSAVVVTSANNNNNDQEVGNPVKGFFQEVGEMFSNMDDVMDDFFMKRMGNGEQFYGKRKYKASGKVEGDYNGMGLSDKLRIDVARARKEEFLEERERRRAEAEKRK